MVTLKFHSSGLVPQLSMLKLQKMSLKKHPQIWPILLTYREQHMSQSKRCLLTYCQRTLDSLMRIPWTVSWQSLWQFFGKFQRYAQSFLLCILETNGPNARMCPWTGLKYCCQTRTRLPLVRPTQPNNSLEWMAPIVICLLQKMS